jgi:hypothetical protein
MKIVRFSGLSAHRRRLSSSTRVSVEILASEDKVMSAYDDDRMCE